MPVRIIPCVRKIRTDGLILSDPYEDQFAKLTKERNERRAKNELQRLRNISRSIKEGQGEY